MCLFEMVSVLPLEIGMMDNFIVFLSGFSESVRGVNLVGIYSMIFMCFIQHKF